MKNTLDLTRSQLLLWTGQKLNPSSPLYNMAFVFQLTAEIDVPSFRTAFESLVSSCDAMRTVFTVENGLPQQRILATIDYPFEYLDWSDHNLTPSYLQTWAEARTQRLFNLSEGLFDSVLIKLADRKYAWYFNQHHLITDAWGFTVQYKALMTHYTNLIADKQAAFPSLPQFADYAKHEKEQRNSLKNVAVAKYWKEKLVGFPPPPKLYGFDQAKTPTNAERVAIPLGVERSQQLRALARQKELRSWTVHSSLFNILVSLYFAYLYRVSHQNKLCIGAPAHNRSTKAFKQTAGVFIELFPLTVEVEAAETFLSLFKKVQLEANQFLRYAQTGTSAAELSKSFGAVLNYIHAGFEAVGDVPMESTWVHSGHCDPQHHIRMQVYDFDQTGDLQIYLDLNEAVFHEGIKSNVPLHFLKLVDAFLDDFSQPIAAIPLVTIQDTTHFADTFNLNRQASFEEVNVVDLFEIQAFQTPAVSALNYKGQTISYQILNQKANQIAHYLKGKGIGAGERVAIYLKRSPELLYSIYGVLKAGATYIPIPSNSPKKRVLELIEEGEVAAVLSTKKMQARFQIEEKRFVLLDGADKPFDKLPTSNLNVSIQENDLVYVMFTSGSTGRPKGVMIAHRALANYIQWANDYYECDEKRVFPLFTMIGFDLTVTSIFLPLISGGELVIYEEADTGPDLALVEVIQDNLVNSIKLTPSHLALLSDKDLSNSRIQTMIVGGEDFKTQLAQDIYQKYSGQLNIYNEYGPTEATVGCVVHRFSEADLNKTSVPIGVPIANMQVYILDAQYNLVPQGVAGELYLAGTGLAAGYWNQSVLSAERFVVNPFEPNAKMYQTGDWVRVNKKQQLEFLGRIDKQIKIGGIRVEPGEIETILAQHPSIQAALVDLSQPAKSSSTTDLHYCTKCGLPSNYPNATFDEEGVCNFCHSFETFERKAQQYFKQLDDLRATFAAAQARKHGEYDCMMLLSGGKDSTYALGQLVEMGYKVLAFTLDNGYISQQALDNVRRVAEELGVDCVFGSTPAMNEIFVDSLHRHCNVCNGCFKTIYTLSMKIALEKGIPIIVTGLSRGQFFETRLTEELFWNEKVDVARIDNIILNARKEYHRVDDAVKRLLDVSVFEDDAVFDQVQFVDFYRFTDVSLEEMYQYLDQRLPWVRPSDTGRSTNCLINKLGIFVHTNQLGYSNYAFPYSWDVRMGHKVRATAIDEINEPIDEQEVRTMMQEIGYDYDAIQQSTKKELIAFYVASQVVAETTLRTQLAKDLPTYMIPTKFIQVEAFPLTANGKVDRKMLFKRLEETEEQAQSYVAPSNQIEELIADIWQEVLQKEQIGIQDNFLALGGNSLEAIRINARLTKMLDLELPLNLIFEQPTIAQYSQALEALMEQLMAEEL